MNEVIGHFTFRKIKNGKFLIGRYSNRNLTEIFSHQARRVPEGQVGEFIGVYLANWDDIDGEGSSDLTIRFKEDTDNQIYILNWTGGGRDYTGEGFLQGKTLIGSYFSV